MGKASLLLAVLGLGLYSTRQFTDTGASVGAIQTSASAVAADAVARSGAVAGFTRVEQALVDSWGDIALAGSFEGADYTAAATVNGPVAEVVVTSAFGWAGASAPTGFQVQALVTRTPANDGAMPPFLEKALIVDGDFHVFGNVDIVPLIGTSASPDTRIHVNGDMTRNGNASSVDGFGTVSGSISARAADMFQPTTNPGAEPEVVSGAPPIDVPDVDIPALSSAFGVDVAAPAVDSGPALVLNGLPLVGGTADDPLVYRVDGDLQISNVVMTGYIVFLVDGDISISGTVSAAPDGATSDPTSTVAYYSTGDLSLGGNTQFYGQAMIEGDISATGTPDIFGSLILGGDLSLGGNANLHYVPASRALSAPFLIGGTAGLGVLAYTEH